MYAKITIQATRQICMATSGVEWSFWFCRPSRFCQNEEGCGRAMPEAMGQAYNTKLRMRGEFLLI
jgi:hypothetical protein